MGRGFCAIVLNLNRANTHGLTQLLGMSLIQKIVSGGQTDADRTAVAVLVFGARFPFRSAAVWFNRVNKLGLQPANCSVS
jgi:hypothetical protein